MKKCLRWITRRRQSRLAGLAVNMLLGGSFAAACGEAPETRAPIVRDSLGIRIVENFVDDPVPTWRLTPDPLLEIGSATDTLAALFRVEGAHRLGDGRIVIANGGADELRYYRADGAFIKVVGRTGQGPGEFEGVEWTARCGGDSLYVYDSRTRRLTLFDDQGQLIRLSRFMLPDNTLPVSASSCQLGGPFVAAGWDRTPLVPGPHRNPTPIGLVTLGGDPLAMIGEFPGTDRWADGKLFLMGRLLFGRKLLYAIANDRVFVGTADAYEVAGYGLGGTLEVLVRLAVAERPVTETDVEAHIERELGGRDDSERLARSRSFYFGMDLPTNMPPYAAFLVDDSRALWIQDFPGPRDDDVAWRQFSTDGSYLGLAIMPAGFEVFEIGDGYVLGVARDELQVERVQLFGLVRSADTGS